MISPTICEYITNETTQQFFMISPTIHNQSKSFVLYTRALSILISPTIGEIPNRVNPSQVRACSRVALLAYSRNSMGCIIERIIIRVFLSSPLPFLMWTDFGSTRRTCAGGGEFPSIFPVTIQSVLFALFWPSLN
jgi:hypothetical protein